MDLIVKNVANYNNVGIQDESTKDILIKGDRIIKIENHSDCLSIPAKKIIDGTGKMIIPGLINSHLHSHDRFDKGRIDNLPLELWMVAYNCPLGFRDWNPEECYLRTITNCIEQIRSGVTTVIDDVFHSDITNEDNIDAVFQAYIDSGLRARVTIAWSDLPYYKTVPYLDELVPNNIRSEFDKKAMDKEFVLKLWGKFAKKYHGRVCFGISTSGPQRCSDSFMRDALNFSKEFDLPIYTHVLETKTQQITGHLKYGKSVVEYLSTEKLISPKTNLIHCVWVNAKDINIIAENGSKIVHNPVSNLKLGSGIAPISDFLKANINVGIGTDNNNCNDSANLIEAIKTAALISKVTTGNYTKWVGARKALDMATIFGAKCFDAEDIGELKEGYKADFTLVNITDLNYLPKNNRIYQFVYGENGKCIDTVIVDGKVVMEKTNLLTINVKEVENKIIDRQDRISEVIDKSCERTNEILPIVGKAYQRCCDLASISSLEKKPASI